MRDVKPAEMTSWLCHLLFLDGQGLHMGAGAWWTFSQEEQYWGDGGQWGGGKELHVRSQEGGEVCRELESAHGSKKCL